MEKMIIFYGNDLSEINEKLENGWSVKSVIPFTQTVSNCKSACSSVKGAYGVYVVLKKEEI